MVAASDPVVKLMISELVYPPNNILWYMICRLLRIAKACIQRMLSCPALAILLLK